jgi:Family of unknown function (DUF5681)
MKKTTKKRISTLCAARSSAPVSRRKKLHNRPRGKPFAKGNKAGTATQFKPGQSGNPNGRPRTKLVREALVKMLQLDVRDHVEIETNADALAWRLICEGKRGKLGAIAEVADRTEGRATVRVDLGETDPLGELIASMRGMAAELGPPENEIVGDDGIVQ